MWISVLSGGPALFCASGVIVFDQKGLKYFMNYKPENSYSYFSLRSILADNGGGNINCDLDSKFFYCNKDSSLWVVYNNCKNIVICKNGTYIELPPPGGVVSCLLEHSNGKILAGTSIGLLFYNGSQWEPVAGLEGIPVLSLVQDKTGKIWGISSRYIFRQNDFNWEIIDNSNSDIGTNVYKTILEDNNGIIWVYANKEVVKTKDGYHWTHCDTATVDFPINQTPLNENKIMRKDSNGNVALLFVPSYCRENSSWECVTIKPTFKGEYWQFDTLTNPFSNVDINFSYLDAWGDIWIYRHMSQDTSGLLAGLYRYTGTQWIKYNQVNAPFTLAIVIGEMQTGKVFAVGFAAKNDTKMTLFSFERNTSSPVSSVLASKRTKQAGVKFQINRGNTFSLDVSLTKAGNVSLDLYLLSGRLVRTLASGYREKGSNRFICEINSHKGLYFVRTSTPDGIFVNKVVAK